MNSSLNSAIEAARKFLSELNGEEAGKWASELENLLTRLESEVKFFSAQYGEEHKNAKTGLADLSKLLSGSVADSLGDHAEPARELATFIDDELDKIAAGVTLTTAAGKGLMAVLSPIANKLAEAETLTVLSGDQKRALGLVRAQLHAGNLAPFRGEDFEEIGDFLAHLHFQLVIILGHLTVTDLIDLLEAKAAEFELIFKIYAIEEISAAVAQLDVARARLREVHDDLKKEYDDILNFEAGAKRCVATINMIGSALTLLAVI